MKRPITSPCSAVLTSSPMMILKSSIPSATSAAAKAPETSLWSVTAIAPKPRSRAVSISTSTGVAQSEEWSVCMWRSTSISGRSFSRLRIVGFAVRGRGGARSAAGRSVSKPSTTSSQVGRLRLVRRQRLRRRSSSAAVLAEAGDLAGKRDRIAGREEPAALAVADQLRRIARSSRSPARHPRRAPAAPRREPAGTGRGRTEDVAAREQLGQRGLVGADHLDPVPDRLRDPEVDLARLLREDASPSSRDPPAAFAGPAGRSASRPSPPRSEKVIRSGPSASWAGSTGSIPGGLSS